MVYNTDISDIGEHLAQSLHHPRSFCTNAWSCSRVRLGVRIVREYLKEHPETCEPELAVNLFVATGPRNYDSPYFSRGKLRPFDLESRSRNARRCQIADHNFDGCSTRFEAFWFLVALAEIMRFLQEVHPCAHQRPRQTTERETPEPLAWSGTSSPYLRFEIDFIGRIHGYSGSSQARRKKTRKTVG